MTTQRNQDPQTDDGGLDTSGDNVEFVFHEGYYAKGNLTKPITVTEYLETDLLAQIEWIKFFALPFNLEFEADEVFDEIKGTMDCIGANTATFKDLYDTEYKTLTVMTAAYQPWSSGWVVSASCDVSPDIYCDVFNDLGVTKIGKDSGYTVLNNTGESG